MMRIFVSGTEWTREKNQGWAGRGRRTICPIVEPRGSGVLPGCDLPALDAIGEEKGMDMPSLSRRRSAAHPARIGSGSIALRSQKTTHIPNEIAQEASLCEQAPGPPRPRVDAPTGWHPIQT